MFPAVFLRKGDRGRDWSRECERRRKTRRRRRWSPWNERKLDRVYITLSVLVRVLTVPTAEKDDEGDRGGVRKGFVKMTDISLRINWFPYLPLSKLSFTFIIHPISKIVIVYI